jgi:hypothetical protein
MNINVDFDGKYEQLRLGFRYKDGRQHPKFDWLTTTDTDSVIEAYGEANNPLDEDFIEGLAEALTEAYRATILGDKPRTVGWYLWQELADSIRVTIG